MLLVHPPPHHWCCCYSALHSTHGASRPAHQAVPTVQPPPCAFPSPTLDTEVHPLATRLVAAQGYQRTGWQPLLLGRCPRRYCCCHSLPSGVLHSDSSAFSPCSHPSSSAPVSHCCCCPQVAKHQYARSVWQARPRLQCTLACSAMGSTAQASIWLPPPVPSTRCIAHNHAAHSQPTHRCHLLPLFPVATLQSHPKHGPVLVSDQIIIALLRGKSDNQQPGEVARNPEGCVDTSATCCTTQHLCSPS
jgi:hypothetical protein